jgi:hypothetical protein
VLDIVGINSTLQMAAEIVEMLGLIVMVGQGGGVLLFNNRAAGGDAPALLDPVDEALDQIARLVRIRCLRFRFGGMLAHTPFYESAL